MTREERINLIAQMTTQLFVAAVERAERNAPDEFIDAGKVIDDSLGCALDILQTVEKHSFGKG